MPYKTNIYTNYHSHSYYCDGKGLLEDYVRAAIAQNMLAFGFSGHAPIPITSEWNMSEEDFSGYFAECERLKNAYSNQIDLWIGLEIDYLPTVRTGHPTRLLHQQVDYTIGSTHYVGQFPDGSYCEIDGSHQKFLHGLSEIYNGDISACVVDYFNLTREMIKQCRPTVVGHLDKIKIQFENGKLFSEDNPIYRRELMATLETIREYKIPVEVNTRGIYKKYTKEPYPSIWVLKEMYEMGIAVQVNSDAHHPREISAAFPPTYALLAEIGFKKLATLAENGLVYLPFNKDGLIDNTLL